jgi:hypothetical protein
MSDEQRDREPGTPHTHQHHVQVQADPETSLGVYANLMMVSHRKEEFILDFLFAQPQQTAPGETIATLRARIVTTPEHAKRIVRALQENIHRYEAAFGVTAEATDLPRNVH